MSVFIKGNLGGGILTKIFIDGVEITENINLIKEGEINLSVSTLPYNFYDGSAVVYNNEIHILGGIPSDARTNHYKYNGTEWTLVSTLPYNFYYGSAVVYNNEIHILGSNASGTYTKHYKYNGTEWTLASTLPYNFDYGSAVVYNNETHILGSNASPNLHYSAANIDILIG